MNSAALLTDLRARGVRIEPRPNGNLYIAPKERLTPELVQHVREHKAQLLDLLRAGHHVQAESDHIAHLDAERSEADRITRRGFDFDPTAPSHEDYLRAQPIPEIKSDPHWTPAYSLVAVCRRYGVALRIDHDGTLVVGKAGAKAEEPTQPWSTLIRAIEAHLDAVAELVASGWSLRAEFPQTEVA